MNKNNLRNLNFSSLYYTLRGVNNTNMKKKG